MSHTPSIVVIGSGPGGLTVAATLAALGHDVTVVEHHDIAGGNCTVFRHSGYEFDVGLHYVGNASPGTFMHSLLRLLGIADRIAFRPLDREFDTLIFPGLTFRVSGGWTDYAAQLTEHFPDDASAISKYVEILRAIATQARSGQGEQLFEWGLAPLSDLYQHCGLSKECRGVLSHWNGLYGSAPHESAVAIHALITDHFMTGASYPEGGGQMIPARLVEVIEACGGQVRVKTTVRRVVIDNGRATGVELQSGEIISADVVISNADYKRTMLELVGPDHLTEETATSVTEAVMTYPLLCVYIVVDIDLSERIPNTNFFVFPSFDEDESYEQLARGIFPKEPFAYMAFASLKDPGNRRLCPPGHTNFQIMTLAPREYHTWGVESGPADGTRYRRNTQYRERKSEITEALLDQAEKAVGPFRDHIVHIETATPLTQERYTLSTSGTSYGLMSSPAQTGPFRPGYATEIDGLYLVGASTQSGHGIMGTMVGGIGCASAVTGRDLMALMGPDAEPLIDPSILPADSEDWDPMEVSRGAAMRKLRSQRHNGDTQ